MKKITAAAAAATTSPDACFAPGASDISPIFPGPGNYVNVDQVLRRLVRQPLLYQPRDELEEAASSGRHDVAGLFFSHGTDDIGPIKGVNGFFRELWSESKKLWSLAGPAVLISVCQFLVNAVPVVFAGHVSTLALAAISVGSTVISGFVFGIMMGMGSALETLCGQAFGAGELDMLGIYMQRSWVILNITAIVVCPVYVFAGPILRLIGQNEQVAHAAGAFAIWTIPLPFAFAMNFPIQKFLQAQSRVMAMAVISAAVLVLHVFLCWFLMLRIGWGLTGAAVALDVCWWLTVLAQLVYVFSGSCGRAWAGFSLKAFQNIWGFVRLSLASAVMLCLEVWYYMALILIAGYLKNAQVSLGALSICMNLVEFALMVTTGMLVAISVRISNELGAGHPRTAKFSVGVAVLTSTAVGLAISIFLVAMREYYPSLFSKDTSVKDLVKDLTPLLSFCIFVNSIQPVLTGVAIGVGWQEAVAYVNIACYYLFGIPLGLLLGYKLEWGVKGIWLGMLCGTLVQTVILLVMVYRANWNKETSDTEDRIRRWAGEDGVSELAGRDLVEK